MPDTLPMRPELCERLRDWLRGEPTGQVVLHVDHGSIKSLVLSEQVRVKPLTLDKADSP